MLARTLTMLLGVGALLTGVASGSLANDDAWSWEPFGPVGNTDGFVATTHDPGNPSVFWLAGSSSVWVTDDGGDSFSLVLHISRAQGSSRGSSPLEDDDDIIRDFDSVDPNDFESEDVIVDDFSEETDGEEQMLDGEGAVDDEGQLLQDENEESDLIGEATEDGDLSEDRQAAFARSTFGISRLRVIGDDLWVCTSRGLWRVPKTARRLGEATEVRLGRRLGVNDVADGGSGRLYVGTDGGLWVYEQGLGRRSRGVEYDTAVFALATSGTRLFAATSLGLYRGDMGADVFVRSGFGGRGEGGLLDVVSVADRLFAADGSRVYAYGSDGQQVIEAWQVPGAGRLFVSQNNRVWAVGPRGPWLWDAEIGWNRMDETLSDRRLRDGFSAPADAAKADGPWMVRVVGLAGAWRLIPGRIMLTPAQRLERAMNKAFAKRPQLADVIRTADNKRVLTLKRIDEFATQEQLAWLVPSIQFRLRLQQQRDERETLIPSLGQRFLDQVDVQPQGDFVQIMAFWNFMPAVLASLDASRALLYENARIQARRNQRRVREALPSLYRNWMNQQKALWQSEPKTPREAVRALLGVAQLEAQLRVMTAGTFPTTTDMSALLYPPEESR